jgi:crossover junction endodeoxyribonuclease RuvC
MSEKQKYIIGVDPGLTGAIAYLRADGLLDILDMPTKAVKVNGKRRSIIDRERLADRFDRSDIEFVLIEEQSTRPRESSASALKTGIGFGLILGIVAGNYLRHDTVRPGAWKKAIGVTSDKDLTRAKASELMPAAAHKWALAKYDGRAEAALIALYAAQTLGLEIPEVRMA